MDDRNDIAREILLKHWNLFRVSLGLNIDEPISEKAIEHFTNAMNEYVNKLFELNR
jgi:hypothetical protein